ncbi:MAG: type II toxin-antitoxin system RelE/ParE family toxin [Bacteroidales bacterium]|nr:type II toxin-antitoxin system RelE/ParE family toxin [Bacteroidales bacterium]
MEIIFEKEYLSELYFEGKTSDKQHRFQPKIIAKYKKTIDLMESLASVEDFYRYHSLNYERLKGDKRGMESVRVNDQNRIEFRSEKRGMDILITVCRIFELSNHYK